jgi:ABC-type multidrug transport system ATPase subunit
MVSNNILELKNISFFYKKDNFVLKDLNAKFSSGKITALLGINGSGKTTLFKILTCLEKSYSGSFFYNNMEIKSHTELSYKSKLGFMPEFLQLYNDMYITDVLKFLGDLKGYENFDLNYVLDLVNLLKHSHKKVKALSKGMKQRLNLAQAIIGDPKIILFDEPSNGFDCGSITMFYKILRKLADAGSIVLISSHHLTEIYGNVDNVLILSNGNIIRDIDINIFNDKDSESLYKEIIIKIDNYNNLKDIENILYKYPDIKIKNKFLYGKSNTVNFINLILDLVKININIKNIQIENKILEEILEELS